MTAGRLVDLVAKAFEEDREDTVKAIARMATVALKGGDSDPTRETILSYVKPPRPATVRGKAVMRRNRLTPVHYRFAHMVINYLDGRRPDGKHIEVPPAVMKSEAWRTARDACKAILEKERDRRYERQLGSDPGRDTEIDLLAGVYAICRRESSDGRYHQELMILRNHGKGSIPRCYCTYVSEHVVTRGEWALVGHVVHCSMSGHRGDNSNEVGGMYLAHLSSHDMLSGFLAGAGTDVKIPVAMPVVAIKVADAGESILDLGDLGDEMILRAFRKVKADLITVSGKLETILEKQMRPVLFHASSCNPELRAAFADGQLLITSRLREFCKDTFQ